MAKWVATNTESPLDQRSIPGKARVKKDRENNIKIITQNTQYYNFYLIKSVDPMEGGKVCMEKYKDNASRTGIKPSKARRHLKIAEMEIKR